MIPGLYDKFKHWSEKGSIYILSDLHFDDEDCKLMSKDWIDPLEQVNIINSFVKKNDTFICLGDVGDPKYVSLINGYKVLIMGNHDQSSTKFKHKIENYYLDEKDYSYDDALKYSSQYRKNYHQVWINKGYNLTHSPFVYWTIVDDNRLFDEVYDGPLFISDKILLSHEPIHGLKWCLNIHGHDHNGVEKYQDDCKHINLAANVCDYTPISLGKFIKAGGLSGIDSIHRVTIDRAIEKKEKRTNEIFR